MDGLSLALPFDLRLAALRLRDDQGAWLEVEDARVELAPAALLQARLAITNVGARRVALARLPAAAPAPEPAAKEPFSLPQLPDLLRSLPAVTIGRIYVDSLELGQPVLGQAATFALDGSAGTATQGSDADLHLALRRTDTATANLDVAAALDLAAGNVRLAITGSETGGLLASITGRPEAGALRLSLTGDGPIADWRGRLAVEAERLARLELGVGLGYADERHIALDGALEAEPDALPPAVAAIVGTHADLKLRAGQTGPQRFALQELGLRAGSLSLTGSGDADLGADTIDGALALTVPDLGQLAAVAGVPHGGLGRGPAHRIGCRETAGAASGGRRQQPGRRQPRRRHPWCRLRRRLHHPPR